MLARNEQLSDGIKLNQKVRMLVEIRKLVRVYQNSYRHLKHTNYLSTAEILTKKEQLRRNIFHLFLVVQ